MYSLIYKKNIKCSFSKDIRPLPYHLFYRFVPFLILLNAFCSFYHSYQFTLTFFELTLLMVGLEKTTL